MKKIIVIAGSMMFAVAGFSQTAESTTKTDSKAECAKKGTPACCAHAGAVKGCDKNTASVNTAEAQPTVTAPITATEPKKEEETRNTPVK
jgi:hypothetical protein